MANILNRLVWLQCQSTKALKARELDHIAADGPEYIELLCMIFDKDIVTGKQKING